jgi:hypothetical protein
MGTGGCRGTGVQEGEAVALAPYNKCHGLGSSLAQPPSRSLTCTGHMPCSCLCHRAISGSLAIMVKSRFLSVAFQPGPGGSHFWLHTPPTPYPLLFGAFSAELSTFLTSFLKVALSAQSPDFSSRTQRHLSFLCTPSALFQPCSCYFPSGRSSPGGFHLLRHRGCSRCLCVFWNLREWTGE